MNKLKKRLCWLGNVLFVVYLITLAYLMFFSENYGRTDAGREYQYNLVLFREIKRYLIYHEQLGMGNVIINLLGNIAAFMPYGFWLPIMNRVCDGWLRILLWSLGFSLGVEVTQLITKTGAFDVDDLMLNTIGGLLGYGIYCLFAKHNRKNMK